MVHGNGRSNDDGDIVMQVMASKVHIENIKESLAGHEEIFRHVAETQRLLAERVIALEIKGKATEEKAEKVAKFQNRLLIAAAGTSMSTLLALILKSVFHM